MVVLKQKQVDPRVVELVSYKTADGMLHDDREKARYHADFLEQQVKRDKFVGMTVQSFAYIPGNEGAYEITFKNGSRLVFSSSGDDATYTSCTALKGAGPAEKGEEL